MYKAAAEPYGIADIIALALWGILLFFLASSVLLSVILLVKGAVQSKKSAIYLLSFCLILFFVYSPLHSIAAQLAR
jgi:hypothetical protein